MNGLTNKQYMLKYGTRLKTNHIYKNFSEVLEEVGLPTRIYQSKSGKRAIVESLNENTIYERIGQKWIFKENNYKKRKEWPDDLEQEEILVPYDNQEIYYVSSFGRIWNKKKREWITKYERDGRYKIGRAHV